MKNAFGLKIIIPALVLGMASAAPIFAEEDTGSASQSMHQAGESAGSAASDAGQAVGMIRRNNRRVPICKIIRQFRLRERCSALGGT
jgi:hypothetical protein